MSIDLQLFGEKLKRYRTQFQTSITELANATGVSEDLLQSYENAQREPTGDQILILADYFKCDYKFFVSNETLAAFEQTETLFRAHGNVISKTDRWSIQEFLFLCECEAHLAEILPTATQTAFSFQKSGTNYKKHGETAAVDLRRHFGHTSNEIGLDVFQDFRRIGIHIFRRTLVNSDISGLFIRHPTAGRCVLVNYSEDIYRQRFTVAHEAGHAILDDDQDVVITFTKWDKKNLSEVRANSFASHYLMPREFLRAIPQADFRTLQKLVEWASRLKVSTAALAIALRREGLIDEAKGRELRSVTVPLHDKVDAELPATLPPNPRTRKMALLRRGLSDYYVSLCFDGYAQGHVSAGRLAEMLLVTAEELPSIASLYGRRLNYGD